MSTAGVLTSFSPSAMPGGPVMPMDVAMRFYISHSSPPPPLRGFLSSYEELQRNRVNNQSAAAAARRHSLYKPLRPCLSTNKDGGGGGCVTWSNQSRKKRVVFADTKGMSLTAIHVFSKFDDEPFQNKGREKNGGGGEDLQFDMSDLESAAKELKISAAGDLALDFKQPSADYLDFRNRLIQNSVCLENCSLQKRSLTGTVKVRNLGFEKRVLLRATFDSWSSFADAPCTFMNNVYGCQDSDTFSFALQLPAHVPAHNRVEFCICYSVPGRTFWDNNDGKNYGLKHVGANGQEPTERKKTSVEQTGGGGGGVKLLELDFDQFGSPRMSSGLFPGWQSWGRIDSTVPYW